MIQEIQGNNKIIIEFDDEMNITRLDWKDFIISKLGSLIDGDKYYTNKTIIKILKNTIKFMESK